MIYPAPMDEQDSPPDSPPDSPWVIEGISPEAMEKATLASAAAGLSLAQWLEQLIDQVAAREEKERQSEK